MAGSSRVSRQTLRYKRSQHRLRAQRNQTLDGNRSDFVLLPWLMKTKLVPIAELNSTRQLNRSGSARSNTVSSAKEVAKPAAGMLLQQQSRPRHLAMKVDMSTDRTTPLSSHVSPTSSMPGNLLGGHAAVHESPSEIVSHACTHSIRGGVCQAFRSNDKAKSQNDSIAEDRKRFLTNLTTG